MVGRWEGHSSAPSRAPRGNQRPRLLTTYGPDFMQRMIWEHEFASFGAGQRTSRRNRFLTYRRSPTMHLLDQIETQLIANRLPLVGVTLAAVPYANTPFVLTLHWHGFVETRLQNVTDANVIAYQPVPSSALQVNDRWDRLDELERSEERR